MYVELIICYILYPLIILFGVKKKNMITGYEGFISRKESNIFKGIAAWMVIFAHYTTYLSQEGYNLGILYPFKRIGPLGVGIFFFLSGYGLYMSNNKKLEAVFLKKRLINVYLPLVFVQIISFFILSKPYNGMNAVFYILGFIEVKWFIIIILIMYLVYWIIWNLGKYKVIDIFVFTVLLSATLGLFGMEEYWYATNILFPVGIIFAKYQKSIACYFNNHFRRTVTLAFIGFVVSIAFYVAFPYRISVIGKTMASVFLVALCVLLMLKLDLKSPIMEWFGKMSLYLYITHSAVYVFLKQNFALDLPFKTIAFILITVAISYLLFLLMKQIKKLVNV